MATVKQKTIEERYKKLDEIDHILLRSGMYVGSVKNEQRQFFLWDKEDESLIAREVEYCPALLKLIDEVISNSCDEFRRKENMGLDEVNVTLESWVTDDGEPHTRFVCRDNGGIPVVMHKEAGMYVPEMIFSQLRTSSNYDDTESRTWVGTNGVGAKLTGVFSKFFSVETADGKNSFYKAWTNNMRESSAEATVKRSKEHYTQLTYDFDMDKFDETVGEFFTDDFCDVVEKRCIDAAAANPGLKVTFTKRIIVSTTPIEEKTEWKFNSFLDYLKLFSSYINIDEVILQETPYYSVYAFPNSSISQGFVNGAACDNGTHIRLVQSTINEYVADYIKTKKKLEVTPKEITGKYGFFCTFQINCVEYDSQTKSTLTTPANKFFDEGVSFQLSKKFFDSVSKSEIIDTIIDWIAQRDQALDQKKIRELNKEAKKKVVASEKYIPAHGNGNDKILCIFEGQSAAAHFTDCRPSATTYGGYLLRGVTAQTLELTPSNIMKNKELSDLTRIIGLDWNLANDTEDQNEIRRRVATLNYKNIQIFADQDEDAYRIVSIICVFFSKWPWLYRAGCIGKANTPLMVCQKGANTIYIYTWKEFKDREKELQGYNIYYKKGLGSLDKKEFAMCLKDPHLQTFVYDPMCETTMYKWFGKKHVKDRKNAMKGDIMEEKQTSTDN